MIHRESKDDVGWVILLACTWIAILMTMFIHSGANPNFWFDESGQFWMSKGLNHYSTPYSKSGSFSDTIQANCSSNMDPGGYTIGLRWWIFISTSPIWLRSFSFLFFVITMFATAGIAYLWTKSRLISLAVGLITASAPMVSQYAFELRPYSMEVCGVALSVYYLEYCVRKPCVMCFIKLGLVCALFITSRYSFISSAIATGIGVLWTVKCFTWRQRVTYLVLFGVPVLISLVGIYVITLIHQNPNIKPPDYVNSFILHGKTLEQMLNIASSALFSPYGIGSTLFLLLYIFFSLCRIETAKYKLFTTYFIIVLAVNVVIIFFSLLGKYPWCPFERWGISQHFLAMLSWFPSVWMVSYSVGIPEKIGEKNFRVLLSLGTLFTAVSMSGMVHYNNYSLKIDECILNPSSYISGTAHFKGSDSTFTNILALGSDNISRKRVFVGRSANPTIRYLYEYGPLRNYAPNIYPNSFFFEESDDSKQIWESFDFLFFSATSDAAVFRQLGKSKSQFNAVSKFPESKFFKQRLSN